MRKLLLTPLLFLLTTAVCFAGVDYYKSITNQTIIACYKTSNGLTEMEKLTTTHFTKDKDVQKLSSALNFLGFNINKKSVKIIVDKDKVNVYPKAKKGLDFTMFIFKHKETIYIGCKL